MTAAAPHELCERVDSQVDVAVDLSARVRRNCLQMVARARAAHIGSSLSVADILAVLYSGVLRVRPTDPAWPARDRLLVGKGHAAAALYATLAEAGFFPVEQLERYCADGSMLTGHVNHTVPGVELSTGSLGHALPVGCGLAMAAARMVQPWRVYVVASDGELDEGSMWEAMLFAAQHRLGNLTLVVDYNRIQSFGSVAEVLELEPLGDKLRAFRWNVIEVDGHDHATLRLALTQRVGARPTAVIARTVKGKGVPFMENDLAWHYRTPDPAQLEDALQAVRP